MEQIAGRISTSGLDNYPQDGCAVRHSVVRRAVISTTEEAWDIVDCFLRQHCDFKNLPKYDWIIDSLDHDKFIPHPPGPPNAGNIASLFTVMQQVGKPWNPAQEQESQSWLQCLRDWLRRPGKKA